MIKSRLDFSVLTVIACMAVVFLHMNSSVSQVSDTWEWKYSLLNQCLAMWCVPVFFMMTGANLMNYRAKYTTRDYFQKRFFRTVIPLLFWSCVHLVWRLATGTLVIANAGDFINLFTQGKIEPTYWFFYALFAVYLCIPILSAIDLVKNRRLLWYIFSICFFAVAVLPQLKEFLGFAVSGSVFSNFAGHLGYVVLGYLLSTQEIPRKIRIALYSLGVLACVGMFWGSWYINLIRYQETQINKLFMTFGSVNNYLMAAALFVFIGQIRWEHLGDRAASFIKTLAGLSFGIYLVHKLLLYIAESLFVLDPKSTLYKTVGTLALYIVSAVLVAGIRKIKYLKNVIP